MKKHIFLVLAAMYGSWLTAFSQSQLNLAGDWTVKIGQDSYHISLPFTLDMAGIGEKTTLRPSLDKEVLRHLTRKMSYTGLARYERDIVIPDDMAGRPLSFRFERVLWRSRLYVDGKEVGNSCESLSTPHVYALEEGLPAGKHTLRLSVDNTKQYDMSYEDMAHAYTNETQTIWNGVLGEMTLTALPAVSLDDVQLYPDTDRGCVTAKMRLVRHGKAPKRVRVNMETITPDGAALPTRSFDVTVKADTTIVEQDYMLGTDLRLWSELSPSLYHMEISLMGKTKKKETAWRGRFGLRRLSAEDGFLQLNGNRIFLRGTLECCIFPLTGCPPTTDEGWRNVFFAAKQWGLNHLRFHSYCPPDAAFRVADEMGFYLQVELPNWSLKIGQTPDTEAFLRRELDRILHAYGNHPSFCLMTCGNELQSDFNVLGAMVRRAKASDPRHLYAASTFTFEKGHGGHPEPDDQFFVTQWTDKGWVRGQGVFDEQMPDFSADYEGMAGGYGVPLISHEIGQYSVYPDMREIPKYTGTLMPLNLKGIRDDLRTKGLIGRADDYLQASGRLAALLYKEEIERAMRTGPFSGFQLLGLQDFPGQSTALVGLVDAFWDSKGVCAPSDFRQFCAPVVPLARFSHATYRSSDMFTARIEVANYAGQDLRNKVVRWTLSDDAYRIIGKGMVVSDCIGNGGLTRMAEIAVPLDAVGEASRLTLTVAIDGTPYRNSWHLWVYNLERMADAGDVVVTADPDVALAAAQKGAKVLFSPKMTDVNGIEGKFLPVFWSPVHFPNQAGTMGLLPDIHHPALRQFPTEAHSDWQWWSIVKRSRVVCLDTIPGATPILESVDNFVKNRRLATIFEARLGEGKIIVCTADLLTPDNLNGTYKTGLTPELLQLRSSLLSYMQTDEFQPRGTLSETQFRSLISCSDSPKTTNATSIYE